MFKNFIHIGIAQIQDSRLRRYILLINKMALPILFFDSLGALYLLYQGLFYVALIFGSSAAIFGLFLPALNYFGRFNSSRLLFSALGVISVFFLSLYLGEESYAHLVLFFACCSAFCLYSPNEYSLLIPAVSFPMLAFGLLFALDFKFGYRLESNLLKQYSEAIHIAMWSFTFVAIALICFFFTSQEYAHEKKLNEVIASLIEENETRLQAEKNLARAKSQNDTLVNILCHDMSNSFTSLHYAAHNLKKELDREGFLNETTPDHALIKKSLNTINSNLDNISSLIRHVRKMSLMVNDKVELNLVPVCVDDLIRKTMAIFDPILRAKNIGSSTETLLDLSKTFILGDEITLVNEVLANVLSNAIKFSYEQSTIDLLVSEQADRIVIAVRDHGTGISSNVLPTLFNLVPKPSQPGTRGERGHGIGLSLLKNHMALLQAEVYASSRTLAESSTQHGTTINLSFRKASAPEAS